VLENLKCWARISRSLKYIDPWVALAPQEHLARNISWRCGCLTQEPFVPQKKQSGEKTWHRKLRMWGLGSPGTGLDPLCGFWNWARLTFAPQTSCCWSRKFEVSCGSEMSSMTIFDLGSPTASLSWMCLQQSWAKIRLRVGNGPTGLLPTLRLEFEQEPVSTVPSQRHYRLHSPDRSNLLCMQRPATKCACLSGLCGWGRRKVPRNSLGRVLLEM